MANAEGEPELPNRSGYKNPFEYPRGPFAGIIVGVLMAVVAFIIIDPYLLPLGRSIARRWIDSFGFVPSVILGVTLAALTIKLQTELHEWSHYVVRKLHGNEPEFDNMSILTRGNPNVQIPRQWATRGENIIVLLAPLITVDSIAMLLILLGVSDLMTFLAALGFLLNTGSAGNDVLGAYDDYQYPVGTMIYYPEDFPKGFIYEPTKERTGGSVSSSE